MTLALQVKETGEIAATYGGIWDRWKKQYISGPTDSPHVIVVAQQQLGPVMDNDTVNTLSIGGRGSGKSENLGCKGPVCMVDRPGMEGLALAPTYPKVLIVMRKVLKKLPASWISSVRQVDREIWLVNGSRLKFLTAKNPDTTIRGEEGGYGLVDESENIDDYAMSIFMACIRLGDRPHICEAATPMAGSDLQARHEQYENDPVDAKIYPMASRDNPFIGEKIFDVMKKRMDPKLYAQEIGGEWVTLAGRVYWSFARATHVKRYPMTHDSAIGDGFRDVTRTFTGRRFGQQADHLIGVDFGDSCSSVIYKLLTNAAGHQILWAIDEVHFKEETNVQSLGQELKRRGYSRAVTIPDASDKTSDAGRRILRRAGFNVVGPRRNPGIQNRVNAVLAKLRNAHEETTMFVDPKCRQFIKALESQTWANGKPDKTSGYDHILDAAGYPVVYLFPAGWDAAMNSGASAWMTN